MKFLQLLVYLLMQISGRKLRLVAVRKSLLVSDSGNFPTATSLERTNSISNWGKLATSIKPVSKVLIHPMVKWQHLSHWTLRLLLLPAGDRRLSSPSPCRPPKSSRTGPENIWGQKYLSVIRFLVPRCVSRLTFSMPKCLYYDLVPPVKSMEFSLNGTGIHWIQGIW